ncbi:MAG: hypothetical protein ACP6IP_05360 [Candidatus Njordarchaeia archaeon]
MLVLEKYIKNNITQYNVFLTKKLKGEELKKLEKVGERKQQILLITKLLNINQAFKIFNLNNPKNLSELRKKLPDIKGSFRSFQIRKNGERIKLSTLYKNHRFPNFLKAKLSDVTNKLVIIILEININKGPSYIFVNESIVDNLQEKLKESITEIKIKPLAIRRYMDQFNGRVEMMKILIGDEIGGVEGLTFITLEGKDVINGLDNFYRRYKYNTLRFHKIGVLEAIKFSNGLSVSRSGRIYVKSILDLIDFIKYL